MNTRLQEIQSLYSGLMNSMPRFDGEPDYSVLDRHIPYLEQMDSIGGSAVSVFDLYKKTHVFVSPLYKSRLGLAENLNETDVGFEKLMHPDDLLAVMEAGYYFLKMAIKMDSSDLKKFKQINDYRIRLGDGSLLRLIEQHRSLETDPNGNIWLALSTVDVSPDQNISSPAQNRLVNIETGESFTLPSSNPNAEQYLDLTKREKKVLELISKGKISKQVADELFISVHTVNTHRQNIIQKLNVTNTTEAVRLAANLGFIQI